MFKSTAPEVNLYNLTLQRASRANQAIHGNFAGTKQQLIMVGRGKYLEVLRPDAKEKTLTSLCVTEIFGEVRSLRAFRLTGGNKDYVVCGTDSGKITILEYDGEANALKKVHQETYGKSGCRRIVPGQYLATDPKGRAVMVSAFEKQKLVYILNRDSSARLTISSPLEAHKSKAMVMDCVGMDVGFDNPVFACLEMDYEAIDEDTTSEALESFTQTITFYELDLGLNHVVRKESVEVDGMANKLIPVPGGSDGPGGVFVCSPGRLTWHTFGEHDPVSVNIPRRNDPLREDRPAIINCFAMHKTKKMLFFLLQTDEGDVFKLSMAADESEVQGLILKYFDTLDVANSMCLLRNGFLFLASEFGNHVLYRISQLGDNEDEPVYLSTDSVDTVRYFRPRDLLNLIPIKEVESLHPIISADVADLHKEETPQIYTLCGKGAKSSFSVLRHGLEVSEMAQSEVPGTPSAVWSVKRHVDDDQDTYLILSFADSTLVLKIGEQVEEVRDSGFSLEVPTLSASRIGDDSLLQIYPTGIRHIMYDSRAHEWSTPENTLIVACAVNERQVAITLSNNELVYFELDRHGQLQEHEDRMEVSSNVTAMALAPIEEGKIVSQFLALGLDDSTVRILSVDANTRLKPLKMQALPSGNASSLCMIESRQSANDPTRLQLFIGIDSGVMLRCNVDKISGSLSDTRTRYLGVRSVKLCAIKAQGQSAVLALSARPWLSYMYQGQPRMAPLSYDRLESAHAFTSDDVSNGIVAVARNTLRIFSVENLGAIFHRSTIPLQFTPRKLILDKQDGVAIILEGDQGVNTDVEKQRILSEPAAVKKEEEEEEAIGNGDGNASEETPEDAAEELGEAPTKVTAKEGLDSHRFGEPYAGSTKWASQIRVVDAREGTTLQLIPLAQNEMLISSLRMQFTICGGLTHVIVGGVRDWDPLTNKFSAAFVDAYLLAADASGKLSTLHFVHRTEVSQLPVALADFHGRLLVGIGHSLRIYDMGRKRLLRKGENKHIPNQVVAIQVMGTRIVVADQKESVLFLKYKAAENKLGIFCDDVDPRWCTCMVMLDYSTVCVADKFGNIAVLRCPDDVNDEVEDDPTGAKAFWSRGYLNGAPEKLVTLANFHVGEIVQSMHKTTLTPGGTECIVYTTMSGAVGALMPFKNREDMEFLHTLEMHLRQETPPLCGRDHLAYRSLYFPVKSVVDGDLCESFNAAPADIKSEIAEELDRTPAELTKKLEEFRTRYAF